MTPLIERRQPARLARTVSRRSRRRDGSNPTGAQPTGGVAAPARGSGPDAAAPLTREARTAALAAEYGAGRLFLADVGVILTLLNEARYQAFERLGVARQDANLATLIVAGMAADSAHRAMRRLLGAPGSPTTADALLGAGVANGLLRDLAGPDSGRRPDAGALIALAMIAAGTGPAVGRALHGVRDASRRTAAGFHHRYGYVIAARARRAARRESRDA